MECTKLKTNNGHAVDAITLKSNILYPLQHHNWITQEKAQKNATKVTIKIMCFNIIVYTRIIKNIFERIYTKKHANNIGMLT